MKTSALLLLPLLAASCTQVKQAAPAPAPLNVMTFNIRCDNDGDGLNGWSYRKERAATAILFYDVDILGAQEVVHNQLVDLQERLEGYAVVGVGRDDGKEGGEYSPVWYKTDRFSLLDSGWFWLSETPDEVSMGWDAAYKRVATWVKLQEKASGQCYFVLNTHLDHIGETARRESITLILDRVKELGEGMPVIVTGDFNALPDSEVIAHITDPALPEHLTDTRAIAPVVYGPQWSFHDFGRLPYEERELIDYVFVRDGLKALRYGVLAETENDGYLSDHAPVLVTLAVE